MKQGEIEQLLPGVFRRTLHPNTPLWALLEVMESLHQPSEEVLTKVDDIFSPYRTPDQFVAFLARWVDLDRFFPGHYRDMAGAGESLPLSTGLGRLRELIAAAAFLSQWRGTARGLRLFLETATGIPGFELDEEPPDPEGMSQPFHLRVRAPQEAVEHRALVERIIEQEKPAYVTYELEFVPANGGSTP